LKDSRSGERPIVSGNLFQSEMGRGKKEIMLESLYWKKFVEIYVPPKYN